MHYTQMYYTCTGIMNYVYAIRSGLFQFLRCITKQWHHEFPLLRLVFWFSVKMYYWKSFQLFELNYIKTYGLCPNRKMNRKLISRLCYSARAGEDRFTPIWSLDSWRNIWWLAYRDYEVIHIFKSYASLYIKLKINN